MNTNQLITIGHGFNNAVANLNVNAQIAPGIRVAMTSYLSARHHQETWVKDGYLLIDESPIDNALLKGIMKYTTLRVGHFEINYGDAHFRRSDNGNAMYNPFAGNYILDAFTTEIGAEVYARSNGLIAMLGATGGEVHGQVTAPQARSMSVLGKLGFDKTLDKDLRFRLTGSFYANNKAASNTLFTGDRGGSAYYDVLENTRVDGDGERVVGPDSPGLLEQGERRSDQPVHQDRRRRVLRQLRDGDGRLVHRAEAPHAAPERVRGAVSAWRTTSSTSAAGTTRSRAS